MNTYLTYIHEFEFVFMQYVWGEAQITLTSSSNRIAVPKNDKWLVIVSLDTFEVLIVYCQQKYREFCNRTCWDLVQIDIDG